MKQLKCLAVISSLVGVISAQNITVENVFVPKDSIKQIGNNMFSGAVFYDLIYGGGDDTLFVYADFSADSGKSWQKNSNTIWFSGDYGKTLPGTGKRIDWTVWRSGELDDCFLRVFASDSIDVCNYPPPTPRIFSSVLIYKGPDTANAGYLYSLLTRAIPYPNAKDSLFEVSYLFNGDTVISQTFEANAFDGDTLDLETDIFHMEKSLAQLKCDTSARCTRLDVMNDCGVKSSTADLCVSGIVCPEPDISY